MRRGPPVAQERVWWLERSGPSPTDTTVVFPAKAGRTIVMRHGAPDNAIYFLLIVPAGALVPAQGDSARIALRPLPGRYGVVLESPDRFGEGIVGTFSYAIHFQAPSDAAPRYPTPARFEQAVGAARLVDAQLLQFLPTERPAADLARFAVAGGGTYLLAAPK